MNRLFGSKSKAPAPSVNDALDSVQARVASLNVRIAKLNGELSAQQQRLSGMRDGAGKRALKQRALKVLQQRKQVEAQRDQLEAQAWNMEQATMAQESLRNSVISVNAMKQANKDLRKQYGKIDIDKIEDMQDEMAELMEMNEELQAVMGRSFAVPDDVDEAELDAELEALNEEELESTPSYLSVPKFVDEVEDKEPEAKEAVTEQSHP